MFCNNCGKEVLAGNAFCASCGTKVDESKVVEQVDYETNTIVYDEEGKLSTTVVVILSILAFLFSLIGVIAYLYNKNKQGRKKQAETIGKFAIAGAIVGIILTIVAK